MVDESIKHSFEVKKEATDLISVTFKEAFLDPDDNKRQAQLVEEDLIAIINQDPTSTFNLLVNILPIGGFSYMSPEARETYGNLAKLRHLKKTAVVGNNTFLEITVNLIMQASGKALNFRWFKDRNEALEWLKN